MKCGIKKSGLISATWFCLFAVVAERVFFACEGSDVGFTYLIPVALWSFLIGGILGPRLLAHSPFELKHLFQVGLGVPFLTFVATMATFSLFCLAKSPIEMGWTGLVDQTTKIQGFILFSLFGFIFSSWIIFPLGILAAFGLWWIGELFIRDNQNRAP